VGGFVAVFAFGADLAAALAAAGAFAAGFLVTALAEASFPSGLLFAAAGFGFSAVDVTTGDGDTA